MMTFIEFTKFVYTCLIICLYFLASRKFAFFGLLYSRSKQQEYSFFRYHKFYILVLWHYYKFHILVLRYLNEVYMPEDPNCRIIKLQSAFLLFVKKGQALFNSNSVCTGMGIQRATRVQISRYMLRWNNRNRTTSISIYTVVLLQPAYVTITRI